jgi:hypothetical protein
MFPEKITDAVYNLRRLYQRTKTCVVLGYPIIEIITSYRNQELSTKLFFYPNTNTLEIQPMDVKYYQKISFYDYAHKTERRWVRNKRLKISNYVDSGI